MSKPGEANLQPEIPFVRDFSFEYEICEKVSDHIWRMVANNPGPFTGWGTNVYVVGDKKVLVIDPGPDTNAQFAAVCRAVKGRSVIGVCVTHHHLDHSPLAPKLSLHFNCPSYGFGPPAIHSDMSGTAIEEGEDRSFCPDIKLEHGQILASENWQVKCLHTPGHTSNHMCYEIQPDNQLVCGDHVLGWATSVVIPPDGDMEHYLHSLEQVRAANFTSLLPAHGPEIKKPEAYLDAYIAHRHFRDRQIVNAMKETGLSIRELVDTMYQGLDPRLHPAACVSVYSHLIRLVKLGKVSCDEAPALNSTYKKRPEILVPKDLLKN